MSIPTELSHLTLNKAAIKAAIEAKLPSIPPTDALSQWPKSIMSIPYDISSGNKIMPYPWVGTGTHAWVHYDLKSISHLCQLRFTYSGSVTLDWGDGSSVVTLTSANKTTTTQTHTYSDGDYRIDISGTLYFGSYTYSNGTFTYSDTYGSSFMTNDLGFGSNLANSVWAREALVQFETDAPMFVGTGNSGYVQIGATSNLRWIKLTEATAIAQNPFAYACGLIGLYAPKCEKFWGIVSSMESIRILHIPLVTMFTDESGARQSEFRYFPLIEEFSTTVSTLPTNFLAGAYSLRSISIPNASGIVTNILKSCYSLCELEIPEGVTEMASECCRNCISLNKLVLPSTLTSISNAWAFYGPYSLKTIICRATTPPTLVNDNILKGPQTNEGFAVWVPQGTVSTYESATNWTKFAGKFHELDANGNIPD